VKQLLSLDVINFLRKITDFSVKIQGFHDSKIQGFKNSMRIYFAGGGRIVIFATHFKTD
jgi:hypothetical protein